MCVCSLLLLLVVEIARRGHQVEPRLGVRRPSRRTGARRRPSLARNRCCPAIARIASFAWYRRAWSALQRSSVSFSQVLLLAHRAAAVGGGEVPLAQLDHQLLPRLILDPCQRLQREVARRVEPRLGQVRPADDVGVGRAGPASPSAPAPRSRSGCGGCRRCWSVAGRGCRGSRSGAGCRAGRRRGGRGRTGPPPSRCGRPGRSPSRRGRGTSSPPTASPACARTAASARSQRCAGNSVRPMRLPFESHAGRPVICLRTAAAGERYGRRSSWGSLTRSVKSPRIPPRPAPLRRRNYRQHRSRHQTPWRDAGRLNL